MFRLWAKIIKNNHMLRDTVIEISEDDTFTHKVFKALDEVVMEFDLSKPIWLDKNISDFKKNCRTRFYKDNFVDDIDFDYLDFHVIEIE